MGLVAVRYRYGLSNFTDCICVADSDFYVLFFPTRTEVPFGRLATALDNSMWGSRKAELFSMSLRKYVAELDGGVEAETSFELFRNPTEPKCRTVKSNAFRTSHGDSVDRKLQCSVRKTPFLQTLASSLSDSKHGRHRADVAFLPARDKPLLRVVSHTCFLG